MALKHRPARLVLSREPLPVFNRAKYASASGLVRGAYVMADTRGGPPEILLIGTGSEVGLCLAAYENLKKEGVRTWVVSMPSCELFEQQDQAYRDPVLPPAVKARVSLEAGSILGWDHYVGSSGAKIGMHIFGSSAPLTDLMTRFGFTPVAVREAVRQQLAEARNG
jgi:transketolase